MTILEWFKKYSPLPVAISITLVLFFWFWILAYSLLNDMDKVGTAFGIFSGLATALAVAFVVYSIQQQQKQIEDNALEQNKQKVESTVKLLLEIIFRQRSEIKYYDSQPNSATILVGIDAVNSIAAALLAIDEERKQDPESLVHKIMFLSKVETLYVSNGQYLRHYFDAILYYFEYVDSQKNLDQEEKEIYMKLLQVQASHNDMYIWHLMRFDYEKTEGFYQTDTFNDMLEKYPILSEGRLINTAQEEEIVLGKN